MSKARNLEPRSAPLITPVLIGGPLIILLSFALAGLIGHICGLRYIGTL